MKHQINMQEKIMMITSFRKYFFSCAIKILPIFVISNILSDQTKSRLKSLQSNSTDEDVLTVHEAALPNIHHLNPKAPIYNENVDEISSEPIIPHPSIRDEGKVQKLKARGRKSEYLKRSTFKTFQTVAIPTQNNSYKNISSGICRIPTLQAMAIVGLRSSLNQNDIPNSLDLSSGPKKSATFCCDPSSSKNKSFSSNTEAVVSSLLVTSSSPNLSPQTFATKCTKLSDICSTSPPLEPDYTSNLILNPVFENLSRPVNLSVPVEIVTTSLKG